VDLSERRASTGQLGPTLRDQRGCGIRCLQQLEHDPELEAHLMATSCCRESVDAAFVRQLTDRRDQPRLSKAAGALEEQHSARAAARAADYLRRKLPCLISLD
jgi:hypothetical protein